MTHTSESMPHDATHGPGRQGGYGDDRRARDLEVECPYCSSPSWPGEKAWFKCGICGERVWLDGSNPYAPPRIGVRKKVEKELPEWSR